MLAHSHHRSRLLEFGTFRPFPAGGLQPPAPQRCAVLVVPETGIPTESTFLFQFALECARELPDHHFIFRCHPIMPFDRIRPQLAWSPETCANVEVSGRPMPEDYGRSSVVLYRGSSSVLYAVMHGLKPVYVRDRTARHGDPLFALADWRESVDSVDELRHLLHQYATLPFEDALQQWKVAAEYVSAYTIPVSAASIERFLDVVGLLEPARCG